jgi:hypothetical protein
MLDVFAYTLDRSRELVALSKPTINSHFPLFRHLSFLDMVTLKLIIHLTYHNMPRLRLLMPTVHMQLAPTHSRQ